MDEVAFTFYAEEIKKWTLDELRREVARIKVSIKGWDQFPFGACNVRDGERMLKLINKERNKRNVKAWRDNLKKKEVICGQDQEGEYPDC